MKPQTILAGAIAILLWTIWCVVVVTELVPALRRHVLMWPWLMSYTLCLAPVVLGTFVFVIRSRPRA